MSTEKRAHVKAGLIGPVGIVTAHRAGAPRKAGRLEARFSFCPVDVANAAGHIVTTASEGADRTRREAGLVRTTLARARLGPPLRQRDVFRERQRRAIGMPKSILRMNQQPE